MAHTAAGYRFAIIVSRFNEEITEGLLTGARAALESAAGARRRRHARQRARRIRDSGARREQLAETGRFDAIICLGCVIKGDTMHFEYIASAVSQGIMDVGTANGYSGRVRRADDVDRRAGGGACGRWSRRNKGREAAMAAVEMATLSRRIGEAGRHEH